MPILPQMTANDFDLSMRLRMERLARPLLEQLLTRAARFQDTPLQFEIDTAGIALAAWNSFWPDVPPEDRQHLLSDGTRLCSAVDELIEQAFEDDDARNAPDRRSLAAGRITSRADVARVATANHPLARIAEWLDQFCGALRLVHPRTIEVIRRRVEGYAARDIAIRMGTGAHLVRRILADARREVKQGHNED